VLPMSGTGFVVGYRLINFETSKPDKMSGALKYLLRDHTEVLDLFITHLVHNPTAGVQIEGFASRRADETYNEGLSFRRATAVQQYLEQGVTKLNVQLFNAWGESQSGGGDNNNDGVWRAASIRLFDILPNQKAEPPNSGPKFQNFAVRVSSIASVSIPLLKVVQLDMVVFSIVDIDRQRIQSYQYTGVSGALPSPFSISPVSFAASGPWKTFRVMRHDPAKVSVTLADFAGKAVLTQAPGAGVGSASAGGSVGIAFESANLTAKGVGIVPGAINLSTGSGFSLPALGSAGGGELKLMGEEEGFATKIVDGQST